MLLFASQRDSLLTFHHFMCRSLVLSWFPQQTINSKDIEDINDPMVSLMAVEDEQLRILFLSWKEGRACTLAMLASNCK